MPSAFHNCTTIPAAVLPIALYKGKVTEFIVKIRPSLFGVRKPKDTMLQFETHAASLAVLPEVKGIENPATPVSPKVPEGLVA